MSGSAHTGVRLELFVRSLSPRGGRRRIEETVDRIARLEKTAAVSEYNVLITGKQFPATRADTVTETGVTLRNRVSRFTDWAEENGCSLDGLIQYNSVYSEYTGETHETIVMPTMAMAEFDGRKLQFVAPCRMGDERVTIESRLDALASRVVDGDDDVELDVPDSFQHDESSFASH